MGNNQVQRSKLSELPEKQLAFALLRQQGVSIKDAAKALDYKRSTAYTYESRIKKLDLTAPKMVKKAHNAINKLVQGKAFGDIDYVKDSTALKAAEVILDRAQPKVTRTENLNLNATISPVDLSRYRVSGREASEDGAEATVAVQGIAEAGEDG